MSGLQLQSGLRLRAGSGTSSVGTPNTGTVDSAAFAPGRTQQMTGAAQALTPSSPPGLTLWVGVGCLAALVLIRQSLPK